MNAKKQSALKYTFIALFIATAVVICFSSLIPGDLSAKQSNTVGAWVANIITFDTYVPIESLSIYDEDMTYNVGDTLDLTVSFAPEDSTFYPFLLWESKDTNIAEVSLWGEVTFLKEGSAEIVATYAYNDSIKATITLTCMDDFIPQPKENQSFQISMANTLSLYYWLELSAISLEDYSNITPIWSVEDSSVATILNNKYIVGKNLGQTTLTATYGETQESILINVGYNNGIGYAEAIELGAESENLQIYSELQLNAIVTAEDREKEVLNYVIWESVDPLIATVSKEGVVYGKSPGTTRIYARWLLDESIESFFDVTVVDIPPQGLSVLAPVTLERGGSEIVYAVFGNNPFDKRLRFVSDDDEILTVNQKGVITARKNGTATVTVTSLADETVFATVQVKVVSPPFDFTIRKLFGHYGLFCVLAVFGTLALRLITSNTKIRLIVNLSCGAVIATFAEILQLPVFTTGRHATVADVFINFSGYLTGFIVTIISIYLRRLYKEKQKNKASQNKDLT